MDNREHEAPTADRGMIAGEAAPGVIRRRRIGCVVLTGVAAAASIGCGGASQPSVGDCTTGDASKNTQEVTVVDCADSEAKTQITKKAKSCPNLEATFDGQKYCLKPK